MSSMGMGGFGGGYGMQFQPQYQQVVMQPVQIPYHWQKQSKNCYYLYQGTWLRACYYDDCPLDKSYFEYDRASNGWSEPGRPPWRK